MLRLENIVSAPLEEGDAGIILKPDGTHKVFTTGHIDAANLTEAQAAQGEKLAVLHFLLSNEHLYQGILRQFSEEIATAMAEPPAHH